MISVQDALVRLRRTPPRRLPVVVGRYALRTARTRTQRWQLQRHRGELSDSALLRSLGAVPPEIAFERFVQRFFVQPASARERAQALATAHPRLAERTRKAADAAVEHVVDLLGSGPVALGQRIDWHADFKTRLRWPRDVLADDQDYLRLGEPCDVKVPWELSRCHHWVSLGRAFALTGDERYASEFVAQLGAWLDDNPWPYGVNWGRAMEVAVRAVNWMWAAALMADAPEFSSSAKTRLLKALLQHGRHIRANLEYADINGNHYLSNGVGLLFLGVLLRELAEAAEWRRKGAEIVWGEIGRQVHPDGVDFEQGIGYQGLVLEFWYSCLLLCQRNDVQVPDAALERIRRMFEFVYAYTRPDGTFPQIGDNDDGRLAGTDDEPVGSHRRHLAVGAALFARPEWLAAAGDAVETALWLCGAHLLTQTPSSPETSQQTLSGERFPPSPAEASQQTLSGERFPLSSAEASRQTLSGERFPAEPASRAFASGGFYVLRSPESVMIVDAGEVGMAGIGGHGHNDVLSFDLWAAGAPLLVDSGTYAYTADPAARQAMRSTAAHNALRLDGQETSRLAGERWLWQIANDAHPTVLEWSSTADRDLLAAEHDGYTRLPRPVIHRRAIAFDKTRHIWRIEDSLRGTGEHLVELFFHPAAQPIFEDTAVRLTAPDGDLLLLPPAGLSVRQEPGWISRGYGHREPATVLVYATRAMVPLSLRTDLMVVPRGTPLEEARSLVEDD